MEPNRQRALFCEGACRSTQPHTVIVTHPITGGENLLARCSTCARERRRSVIHVMTVDGQESCTAPGEPAPQKWRAKVTCEACMQKHEQRLTRLPDATHWCYRCKAMQPHQMSGALRFTDKEYVVSTCQACSERVETVGLRHLPLDSDKTRCLLPNRPERKVILDLGSVDCPDCLGELGPGEPMYSSDLPPRLLTCRGCVCDSPHSMAIVVFDGLERLIGTCQKCGHRRASGMLRHSSFEDGQTLCERATGQVKIALRHEQITCVPCLRHLLEDRLVLPVPDWRPDVAISEDHYAL